MMGIYESVYQVIKYSWGISITLVGEFVNYSNFEKKTKCFNISPEIWGLNQSKISINEEKFLWKGLSLIKNKISNGSEFEKTLIIIHDIKYSICDYQADGLSAAIIKWCSEVFNFEPPVIEVFFDKKLNKYIYNFDHSSA